MAKAYTDIGQSKKLAEVLSPESADMFWREVSHGFYHIEAEIPKGWYDVPPKGIPCWSLAALLDVLNKAAYFMNEAASVNLSSYKTIKWTVRIDNSDLESITEADPIDACVQMILKFHESNLL